MATSRVFLFVIMAESDLEFVTSDSLLVSWDVVAMFTNIDNNLGINAITDALNSRDVKFPSTECIVEAVEF